VPYPLSLLSRMSNDQLRATAEEYRWKARAASLPEAHDALIRVVERLERVIAQREAQRQRCLSALADTPATPESIVVMTEIG
jgi:hypothetical protein